MENKRIYLCLAHMSEDGMEQKYVKEAFDTNWVVPLGPNVNGFEKDLEEFVNGHTDSTDNTEKLSKRVVALSSGTASVHLGLLAAGVKAGDEVIVQSFTFCASTHPVTYLGATPVLVDSEPDTWNIDPELLEKAILDNDLHLRDDLSRRLIGEYVSISKNRFAPLFRKFTGMAFPAYINSLRMQHAATLLAERPDHTSESVANDCGISVPQTFYRLFKLHFGMTPAAYRLQHAIVR